MTAISAKQIPLSSTQHSGKPLIIIVLLIMLFVFSGHAVKSHGLTITQAIDKCFDEHPEWDMLRITGDDGRIYSICKMNDNLFGLRIRCIGSDCKIKPVTEFPTTLDSLKRSMQKHGITSEQVLEIVNLMR